MSFLSRICLVVIILLLPGCADKQRDSIAFGLNTAPVTLDPRFATDAVSYRITRLLYRSLVDFDDQFRPIPQLANWEKLAADHYRFTLLGQGRDFHDGSVLTSSDIKATYESILEPELVSPHRSSVAMIKRIDVIDDITVDFILNKDDPLFPGRLVIGILPARLIKAAHPFQTRPVGSGPVMFEQWPDESRLVLKRLTDGQRLELITVKDPTVRTLKLLRGELDILQGNLSPEVVRWLQEQDGISITKSEGDTFTYLGFNLQDETTGQLQVRQAIAHAIDREAIIHYVLGDSARPAAAILAPIHWAGHPELEASPFNPERARQLLAGLGYSETKPLQLSYKTSNNPFRLRLATIIQSQLRAVGIDVDIQSYDWGTFYADIKNGRFQMYSLSWVGLKMPDIFRYVFHSTSVPPVGANRGRLQDDRVDALIEQAESVQTLTDKAAYYRQLQSYLGEVLPYVSLWYEDNVLAVRQDITGYNLANDGNFDALINAQRIKSNDSSEQTYTRFYQ